MVILLFIKKQTDFEYSKKRGRDMVAIDSTGLTPSRQQMGRKEDI